MAVRRGAEAPPGRTGEYNRKFLTSVKAESREPAYI
jgi:hypothetical protein